MNGTSGNDILSGTGGDDVICAGAGDDTIQNLGAGNDVVLGGPGEDVVSYASSGSGVGADLSQETANALGVETLRQIEDVTGSSFDDVIITTTPGLGRIAFDRSSGSRSVSYTH